MKENMISDIKRVLNIARWAPSGDNSQPWKFQLIDESSCFIHTMDNSRSVIFDHNGRPSQISIGCLLSAVELAAERLGFKANIEYLFDENISYRESLLFKVVLERISDFNSDHIDCSAYHIETRSVHRGLLKTNKLSQEQKQYLTDGLSIQASFIDQYPQKFSVIKKLISFSEIRFLIPETYTAHRDMVEWGAITSQSRIPEYALGLNSLTRKIMKYALTSYDRLTRLNKYLGTKPTAVEVELLPGIFSGGYVFISPNKPLENVCDYIEFGKNLYKFWLRATVLSLQLQPNYFPILVKELYNGKQQLTKIDVLNIKSVKLMNELSSIVDTYNTTNFIFRYGFGKRLESRSVRKYLENLIV